MWNEHGMVGNWWMFPMMMCIIVMVFFFIMSGRRGWGPPWMRGSDRFRGGSTGSETPMDILKKRYAQGEITKAEFEEMKKELLN
ncbi:MAG: SHOCT domain-containing protein [Candidatus Neomarinimicrobiota bacterium]